MHETDIAADFLKQSPPFDRLDEDALRRAASGIEVAYYREGQAVLNSSEGPGVALIRKGAVRLVDADHRFLDKRSEGECFGHAAWFRGEQLPYRAEAEEDSLVWHLPAARFDELRQLSPDFAAWFEDPPARRLNAAAMSTRPARRIADLLRRAPVYARADESIRDTASRMRDERVSSVLILDDGRLAGIVTDKDLRRRVIAAGHDPSAPIHEVMTPDPSTLSAAAGLDEALLMMMRRGYHHLPVMEDGKAVGLVTAGDLHRAQSEHPLRLLQDIKRARDVPGLEELSLRISAVFTRMVNLGRDVEQVGRLVTQVTDAFTIRLVELAAADLGPAPMDWAWVAFGSQGRMEQTARTDQDNGIITADKATGEAAQWFDQLSRRVCEGLDQLGYVFCPGEIMALNPKWRVSLDQWRSHFDRWIESPTPKSVMHSTIFFDLRCITGSSALVESLRGHALAGARDNRIFRRFMAANAITHRPPLGFFRQFVQEDEGSADEGLNLKHRGIVPIIDLVRLRALEGALPEINTFDRLRAAVEAGIMNEADATNLADALNLIGRLRLEHQARQLADGEAAGNLVPVTDLSPLMRRNLKAAFMLVREAQQGLMIRYQVH
jgi:CBS domain-containing protein